MVRAICIVAIAGISVPTPLAASTVQVSAQNQTQRNLADFDFVASKIRDNYAGWHTKVTPATKPKLDSLTVRLRAKAASGSDTELLDTLREWIGFFNDRHVGIGPIQGGSGSGTASIKTPSITLDEKAALAQLNALGGSRAPIEGLWTIDGDAYRLAIVRSAALPDRFQAIVLSAKSPNWKPGQIKAEFTRRPDGKFDSVYRSGDHIEARQVSELIADGQAVSVPGWVNLIREWPAVPDARILARMLPPSDLSLENYSGATMLLRIPDFRDNRARPLRDLIAQHKTKLDQTPNLIIDLRNNGGGSDFVYDPLIPYLYTRPIVTIGMEMRASADNITLRHAIAQELRTTSPETATDIERQNAKMRRQVGQYVGQDVRSFDIDRRESVLAFPKRIAVLIDGAGSTGEQFLLLARQSRKATLFGKRNSAGVLDFANQVGMPTPSDRFRLAWATSRSLRLPQDPVDPDGIPPDIRIPPHEDDPVAFAARWLERQTD